jgi:hypothetical protein
MPTALELKENQTPETPLLLFDCRLADGSVERWSTHQVTFEGHDYAARVLEHSSFDMKVEEEGVSRVSLTLANADSYFSQLERSIGLKGARLDVRLVFWNLGVGEAASTPVMLFRGLGNSPEETTEATMRVSFVNRLSPQRILLPSVRIQKRCPWRFPANATERAEAPSGLDNGKYSPLFRCGYSADQPDGVGNLNSSGEPFTTCDFTRASCEERGMFSMDSSSRDTRRFGGIEFVPASILVRGAGEQNSRISEIVDNEARYNDFVPMIHGTAWYQPPIVFARNDGNLTRMEILLGMGEIQSVVKVVVNDIEIPLGVDANDMTATGWYNVVSLGNRTGGFNLNFTDSNGSPLGDPYGSMAYASIVVPNRIADGRRLPNVKVLLNGIKVSRYDDEASYLDEAFTANPAWIMLDLLRRSGWRIDELDLISFARAAAHCDAPVNTKDLHGTAVTVPRYEANIVLRRRRSAAEILRGLRNAAALYLTYGPEGKLQLKLESKIAISQPTKPAGSNATGALFGGWPAYEFTESSILRRENGSAAFRMFSRSNADSPNRFTLEFQDAFNEYQQDSLSIVDIEDAERTGQDIAASINTLGVPQFDQASRVIRLNLDKSLRGNLYAEFETSIKALGLRPGDLITVTYAKEGFDRQLFRVQRIQPRESFSTAVVTAQIHDENWYLQPGFPGSASRLSGTAGLGIPRPLVGTELDDGLPRFGVAEVVTGDEVSLRVSFAPPAKPRSSAASRPLLGLTPDIETTGGTLSGSQSYYYAVSALDADGVESRISFIVRATISALTNTNVVRLVNLSFSPSTSAFVVYRGLTPQQLFRIAEGVSIANVFEDNGLPFELIPPPDENYHDAHFYWRLELHPESPANQFNGTTIGNSTLSMTADAYAGSVVRITRGKGAGQERLIQANSPTAVAVTPAWTVIPDSTSHFVISEAGWKLGASSPTSPVEFPIPNRGGATLQITGRSANANGQESSPELSPLTRWQIGGGSGGGVIDSGLPPIPTFGLGGAGNGSLELSGVAFETLINTRTISGGTLTLFAWNELQGPSSQLLASGISDTSTVITLTAPRPGADAVIGDLLQIDAEILRLTDVSVDGLTYTVERAVYESVAEGYGPGKPLYYLESNVTVVPFVRDFFGSPASGKYTNPIYWPDRRVSAADLTVTNIYGASPKAERALTSTTTLGLRTLSGGQLTLQVDGPLAIGSSATPILLVERLQAIGEVYAVVAEAPIGDELVVHVMRGGAIYAELTIISGMTQSNSVSGFGLPPLEPGERLTIDIFNVPSSAVGTPGRDLTVILSR